MNVNIALVTVAPGTTIMARFEAAEADDSGSDQIALLRACGAFGEMLPGSNSPFKDHAQGSIRANFVAECMQS